MQRKYSVFLGNVGSCFDRYCPAYGEEFSTGELLDRAASIDLITGVDLVATPDLMREAGSLPAEIEGRGLSVVSVAADIFTEERWKRGAFSSFDPRVRKAAVEHAREAMDFAVACGSKLLTIWPGQDGYDYLFQSDYMQARERFIECLVELCDHRPDMQVGLEYKAKEPRTHSLINTVGTTILTAKATGRSNCRVILDYGHALLGYENPAESVAVLKQFGDMLAHVHINDNYRLWDDDMIVGSVHTSEFLEFFFWLRRTGYDGWLTIDQFPYREDGRDAVEESARWLDFLEGVIDAADTDEIEQVLTQHDGVAASRLMRSLLRAGR